MDIEVAGSSFQSTTIHTVFVLLRGFDIALQSHSEGMHCCAEQRFRLLAYLMRERGKPQAAL